jgi:hypothetical protein
MRGNLRFILACMVLFLAGGLLRWTTGNMVLPWGTAAAAGLPNAADAARVPPEVAATALQFYHAIDKGRYADAYALALENQWDQNSNGTPQVTGLTSETQFVSALSNELGDNGESLNIISLDALETAVLSPAEQSVERYPELAVLQNLPSGTQVERVYEVRLGGTLLGRCSRWDFAKHVRVAQLKGQTGFRLLLPGVKAPHQPHNEEWFLDRSTTTS